MHRTTYNIVGYSYKADMYCPGHIVGQLTVNPGDANHRVKWTSDPESHLDVLARIKDASIDREDETTFDSDDFPKRIYAYQVYRDDRCSVCGGEL